MGQGSARPGVGAARPPSPHLGDADHDGFSVSAAASCIGVTGVVSDWRRRGLVANFCEARNFAGAYRREAAAGAGQGAGDVHELIELTLSSYSDLCAEVLPAPNWPTTTASDFQVLLHITTGELRQGVRNSPEDSAEDGAYEVVGSFDAMRRIIAWLPSSPWGAEVWAWSAKVDGHSLAVPLVDDAAVVAALGDGAGGLLDFTKYPLRPLTLEENEAMMNAAHVSGEAKSASPAAIVLVGPSCAGKTTVVASVAKDLGIDPDSAVKRDSMIIHGFHPQYSALVDNGHANGGIWLTAWTAIKPLWRKAKAQIFEEACANKRDIIMFARGVKHGKRALEGISALHACGYRVHVVGVYANAHDIIERGLARELRNGKRYNRENIFDVQMIPDNFRGFAPSIAQASGQFKIILNANGKEPQVMLEGDCLNGTGSADEVRRIEDSISALIQQVRPIRRKTTSCLHPKAVLASDPVINPWSWVSADRDQWRSHVSH